MQNFERVLSKALEESFPDLERCQIGLEFSGKVKWMADCTFNFGN